MTFENTSKRDKTKKKGIVAGVYIRVSTRKQNDEGYSVDSQRRWGEKIAAEKNIKLIAEPIIDAGDPAPRVSR